MTVQFDRSIEIAVSKPSGFFEKGGNELLVTQLRAQFIIEKNLAKDPNTCDIVINNLTADNRNEFQKKPLHVRISAGYDGVVKRLFAGDVRHVESVRVGTDWETRIQIGDGDRAYRFSRVARSFKKATAKIALQELVKVMGLVLPSTVENDPGLLNQYVTGLVLQGQASKELDRILTPIGYTWSIQDGKLQVLKFGQALQEDAYVINEESGMIGSPAFGTPTDKGKPPTLSVQHLLYPELVPGTKIKVESRNVNGVFKIKRLVESGDTHGQDWMSEIEAVHA